MAQVTVELRELLRNDFKLFDFHYKFDDDEFRRDLERAVIDHYLFHEIAHETPARFKHKFKARWLGLIEYYNKLHNTTLLSYNPLINYSIEEALEQLSNTNTAQDNTIKQTTGHSENTDNIETLEHSKTGNSTDSTNGTNTTEGNHTDTVEGSTTDNIEGTTDNTRTDNLTSGTDSTRTDNLGSNTTSNEKSSDYPQQAIAGGDFLSGERDINTNTTNTGTVTNDSTTTNTGTVTDSGSTTSTASGTTASTTTGENNSTQTTSSTTTSDTIEDIDSTTSNTGSRTGNSTTDKTENTTSEGTTDMSYSKTIEGLTGRTYQELIQFEVCFHVLIE